jgi:hypothetical protein
MKFIPCQGKTEGQPGGISAPPGPLGAGQASCLSLRILFAREGAGVARNRWKLGSYEVKKLGISMQDWINVSKLRNFSTS